MKSMEKITRTRKRRAKRQEIGDEKRRVCSFCSQIAAYEVTRPQVFKRGDHLLVVEDVPTMVCDSCGETYFTGETIDGLERILGNENELAVTRPVQVAQFIARAA